ncbi:hypothetical protein GCK72_008745 [Caenorhabditis remanei]|uniref:F-box domain-containing protein n=1 Tax=Caenorhabditis remanei TaxID=31234 RepID=A0A6A5H131_CAERE|nr:hypothetical protein GCK72_008745 [Caenorhabditis remanei]KAF1760496.1 hypothetical protein GCK72_008745 [Caenorhabditis remanei]
MEPIFPLFRLPEKVILEVIKNFGMNKLFEFSLISTKTKNIAALLGIAAQTVCISIGRFVFVTVYVRPSNMEITFFNDLVGQDSLIHLDSNQPISAYFSNYYNRRVRSSTLFSFNNWLDHIRTVFSYSKPQDMTFLRGNDRFEVESLKNAIKSVDQLFLTGENSESRNRELLEHFKNANKLILERNPFEEACEVQKYFIRNFKSIAYCDDVSLDDMLLVNSKRVEFSRPISEKQFIRFLKHWIRGSNPRLQFMNLYIDIADLVNGEVYLKGINWIEITEESKKEIRQKHGIYDNEMVQIKRNDGTTAVFVLYEFETFISVCFYVLY